MGRKVSFGILMSSTFLCASSALADITAEDVWNNWRDYMTASGLTVTAEETFNGSEVSLSELKMMVDIPDEEGTVTINYPSIAFKNRDDGTVAIEYPSSADIVVLVEPVDDTAGTITLTMDTEGLATVASGEPDDITYTFSAASISVGLGEIDIPGEDIPDMNFDVTMEGVNGRSNIAGGDLFEVREEFSSDSLDIDVRFVDPDSGENVVMTGGSDDFAFEIEATMPLNVDPDDAQALFEGGFSLVGGFSRGASEGTVTGSDGDGPFSVQNASSSGEASIVLNKDEFAVSGSTLDTSFSMLGGGIPFPISGDIGEASFGMAMPLSASEEPREFGVGMTFAEMVIPDLLWNIFDPGAVLERTPATISLDITGTARLFESLFNPEVVESDDIPGELHSLSLNDLQVSVSGAELTGGGDFTFDNSDLESFDGLPRPKGAADFRLIGGNALLDSLIAMGLVSEQDAMGARMMMGIFTVAGPGEDELTSRIEVNDNGHVLANGQRMR